MEMEMEMTLNLEVRGAGWLVGRPCGSSCTYVCIATYPRQSIMFVILVGNKHDVRPRRVTRRRI